MRGTVRAGWHCRSQARASEGGGSDDDGPRSESPVPCTVRAGGQSHSPARADEGGGLPSRRGADLVRVTCGLHRPGGRTMSLPGPGRWGRRAGARACTVRAGGHGRSRPGPMRTAGRRRRSDGESVHPLALAAAARVRRIPGSTRRSEHPCMVKKECVHPTNVSRHILFEIAWAIHFTSPSWHSLFEDSLKTLLEGKLSTKSIFELSWTTIQTSADCIL